MAACPLPREGRRSLAAPSNPIFHVVLGAHQVFYDEKWEHHTICAGYREDNKCADSLWVTDSVEDHLYYFAEEVGVCK